MISVLTYRLQWADTKRGRYIATQAPATEQISLYQMLNEGDTSPKTFAVGDVMVDVYVARGRSADVLLHVYESASRTIWGNVFIELCGHPSVIEEKLDCVEQSLADIARRRNDWVVEQLLCAQNPETLLLGYYKNAICGERARANPRQTAPTSPPS